MNRFLRNENMAGLAITPFLLLGVLSSAVAGGSIYDVKFTVAANIAGITVRMENLVPVKGFQMKIKAPDAPESVQVKYNDAIGVPFLVSNVVKNGEIRIIAQSSSGDPIPPMNGEVLTIPFTIADPGTVAIIDPVIAGGIGNEGLVVEGETVAVVSNVEGGLNPATIAISAIPNPFAGRVAVHYSVERSGPITLVLSDLLGREISRLIDGVYREAGDHSLAIGGEGLPEGVYFLTLVADGRRITRRLVRTR